MIFNSIRFNRQELAGSFGDIGTDFPLIVAMIIAADLHTPSVLIVFGLMQIATGLIYKMPMPVQPLKAMAALVIAQKIAGPVLLGAGLAIGIVMFLLAATGLLDWLTRLVPKAIIRGIQMGLGLSLCTVAFKEYIVAEGNWTTYALALAALVLVLVFIDHKKYPASLLVITLGMVYALIFKTDIATLVQAAGFTLPQWHQPTPDHIAKGFVMLALPQIPLSLGNSIMATRQVAIDFFPDRPPLSIRKIGFTYAIMNLLAPFAGGIPCCHGSGGMVGHYTFGGRTGGSVIIYGILLIGMGVFFGDSFHVMVQVFPFPVLGVILLFEGLALILLVKDQFHTGRHGVIAVLTGVIALGMPYGFVLASVLGTLIYYLPLSLEALAGIGQGRNKADQKPKQKQ